MSERSTITDPASTTVHAQRRRLALMFRAGFALSAAFLLTMVIVATYSRGLGVGALRPSSWWHFGATIYLGLFALAAKRLSIETALGVAILEVAGVLGAILLFAANAMLLDNHVASTFNVVLVTGVILSLRAAIVPSSVSRTFFVSIAGAVASFVLVAVAAWKASPRPRDWETPYLLLNAGLWLASFVAAAGVVSKIVYGLRRQIDAARSVGQYVLHEKLGEGGMGVVYRATHALLKRDTAVKLILPAKVDHETVVRFEREVVQTARLTHPNTVAIYDYGRTPDGIFYYAMEYLDALTLEEIVLLQGPLPLGRAVRILAQVCSSLEEAHELGLVHRDIKPTNVVVTCRSGMPDLVKVLDFGLVKDVSPRGSGTSMSKLLGTPVTMSPESIRDPSAIGPRSDIYSLGAVAYFLLTGTHVFRGATTIEVCAAHLRDQPEAPSTRLGGPLPSELESIVLRALAKDPSERPGSARELRESLQACPGIDPWTDDDAQRWWREVGAQAIATRERRRSTATLETARTLSVASLGALEDAQRKEASIGLVLGRPRAAGRSADAGQRFLEIGASRPSPGIGVAGRTPLE